MADLMTMADDQGPMSLPSPRTAADYGSSAPVSPVTSVAPPVAPATISAHFKMIFLAVFLLTVALLATRVSVAIMVTNPSDSLKDAMATCNLLAIAGFGAMLGSSEARSSDRRVAFGAH
jgi:hypothetical protein